MSAVNRAGVLPKAVIAALVGTVAGVTAGVWSLRQPGASVVATPSATTLMTDGETQSSPSLRKRVAPDTEPTGARANAAAASSDDDVRVLQRARTLARQPDVTALLALRDDVVRRATERGIAGSSSIKSELEEIDLRLNEARVLQLKLDAEELRKAASKPSR